MFDPVLTDTELIFIPNEEYSFYANLNDLESNDNFSSWECSLYHSDSFVKAYENIFTPTKDIISGADYRFYSTFTVPALTNGCYYIVITDTANSGQVLYISNKIRVQSDTTDTYLIRYRNAVNILNFNYGGLNSFYNKFRVSFIKRQPINLLNTDGYDKINGAFQRVRSTRTKSYEIVTAFLGELDHDAFNSAVFHSSFEIKIDNRWYEFILADNDYNVQWSENYGLAQATVRLELADRSSTNKGV